jgi:hypothetical protein
MVVGRESVDEVRLGQVYPTLILGLGERGRQAVEALSLYTQPYCQDLRLFQTVILERVLEEGGWALEAGGQPEIFSDWVELRRRLADALNDACRADAAREAASRGLQPDMASRHTYLVASLADESRADILALCYLLRAVSEPVGELGAHNCLLLQAPSILDMTPETRAGVYATLREIDHTVQVSDYPAPWGQQLTWPPFSCSWLFLDGNRSGEAIPRGEPEAHLLAAVLAAFLSPRIGQAIHKWHTDHAQLPPEVHGRLGAYGSCGVAILDLPLASIGHDLAQDLKARVLSDFLLADRQGLVLQPAPAQFLRDRSLTEESCQDLLPADYEDTIRTRLRPWVFSLDPEDSLLERIDGESDSVEDGITTVRVGWDEEEESSRVASGLNENVRAIVSDVIGQSRAGIKAGRSFLKPVAEAVSRLTSNGEGHRDVGDRREKIVFALRNEKAEQRGVLEEKLGELKALFERRFLPLVLSHIFALLMGVATLAVFPWIFVRLGQGAVGETWAVPGAIVILGLAAACLVFGAYLESRFSGFQLGSAFVDVFHRAVEVPQTRALSIALTAAAVMSGVTLLLVIGPFDWSGEDFRFRWLTFGSVVFVAGTLLTWLGPTLAAAFGDILRGGARPARRAQSPDEDLPGFKSLTTEEQEEPEQTTVPQQQEGAQADGSVDVPAEPDGFPWQGSLIDGIAARLQTIVFWWAVLVAFPVFLAVTLLTPAKERGSDLGFSEFLGLLARLLISARLETVLVLVLGLGLMAIAVDVASHLLMWSLQRRHVAEARDAYLEATQSYLSELLDLQRFESSAVILDALSGLLDRSHEHLQSVANSLERELQRTPVRSSIDLAEAPNEQAPQTRPPWIPTLDVNDSQELGEFLVGCLGGPWENQIVEVAQVVADQICPNGRLFRNWWDISAERIIAEVEARAKARVDALLGTDLEEVVFRRHDQRSVGLLADEALRFCAPWWNFASDMEVGSKMAGPALFVGAAAEERSVLRLFPKAEVVPIADKLRCICLGTEQHVPLTCLPFLDQLREAYLAQDENAREKLHTLADWRDIGEL